MENAVDALKIAFGMLVFVIALTLAFMVFSQAAQTSNKMLFASDKTNYYRYTEEATEQGRIVGSDVVISSLYRYYKESIVIYIYDGDRLIKEFNANNGLSQKEKKEDVKNFIKDKSDLFSDDAKFLETFEEVKVGGEYIIEDDGSELTINPGQISIYVTYKKQ